MTNGRSRGWVRVGALVAAVAAAALVLWAAAPGASAKRFAVVEEGKVYRSGELSARALQRVVERHGIRTVVDLGAYPVGSRADAREQRAADSLGISRVRLDLFGDGSGDPNDYLRALRLMSDPDRQPVLVHCGAGTERTGCAVMLYRHIIQGVAYGKAYEEALRAGHDPGRNRVLVGVLLDWAGPIEEAFRAGGDVAGAPAAASADHGQSNGRSGL